MWYFLVLFVSDHLQCLQWLTRHEDYVPNEKTVHGATAVYFAAQEGRYNYMHTVIIMIQIQYRPILLSTDRAFLYTRT